MPGRVMLLEAKAWRRCLKCGARMFTTPSIRLCPGCRKANNHVVDRLVRVACPLYSLEHTLCN